MSKCFNDFKCLICSKYGSCDLREKAEFERVNREKLQSTIWWNCSQKKRCVACERLRECLVERGLPYKHYSQKNTVVNLFPDLDNTEIIFYKNGFLHLDDSENLEEIDRSRLLELDVESGIYVSLSDDFEIQQVQRSIRNASKRSKDTFYGYAKANDWEYFITLTFSPEIVDRYDDTAVKQLWSEFQRWCVRRSPDVKILVVPERHKPQKGHRNGAIHFHALVSNINFKLKPYLDPRTGKPKFSACGSPLLEILDWKNGIGTLAVIPQDDNYARVCNYMEKYISKEGNIGYCQKRFYRTRNLTFKNKIIHNYSKDELHHLVQKFELEIVKETDKMIVYRKKRL